jgi:hypothetical protein
MPLPAGDCLLEGRLLELWPDGVIARPPRYSEEEWNQVMLPNTKWNHRAECCGARPAPPLAPELSLLCSAYAWVLYDVSVLLLAALQNTSSSRLDDIPTDDLNV